MNLNDAALGSANRASLVFGLAKLFDVGPLADFPLVTDTTGIRAKQTFVDFSLLHVAKDTDIRDERDVEVHGSETVSEPIGFFCTPLTLRGVDRVTMLFQSSEKLVK